MNYSLKSYARIKDSANEKISTKKFSCPHELAMFLVNFCSEIYVTRNSKISGGLEYVVSDGLDDGQNDRSTLHRVRSDEEVIDFCLCKYKEKLFLNGKTRNFFGTEAGKIWRGGRPELRHENYEKAKNALGLRRQAARAPAKRSSPKSLVTKPAQHELGMEYSPFCKERYAQECRRQEDDGSEAQRIADRLAELRAANLGRFLE